MIFDRGSIASVLSAAQPSDLHSNVQCGLARPGLPLHLHGLQHDGECADADHHECQEPVVCRLCGRLQWRRLLLLGHHLQLERGFQPHLNITHLSSGPQVDAGLGIIRLCQLRRQLLPPDRCLSLRGVSPTRTWCCCSLARTGETLVHVAEERASVDTGHHSLHRAPS